MPVAVWGSFIFTCSRFPGSLWMLILVVSGPTCSLARDLCIGTEVKVDKDEAAMRCPLPVNVKDTRHSILVKRSTNVSDPDLVTDLVLLCDWMTAEADQPDCTSNCNISLAGQLTDQVLAKLPKAMMDGVYMAELSPRDRNQPLTLCHLYNSDAGSEDAALVTRAPAPLPLRTESYGVETQKPQKTEIPQCEGQDRVERLCVGILVLQSITTILLIVCICRRCQNKRRGVMVPTTDRSDQLNPDRC